MAPAPTLPQRFIADVHLGRLAHYLRMLGFDTVYDTSYSLAEQVRLARELHRTLLSRNPLLHKLSDGLPFHVVRSEDPKRQLLELVAELQLQPLFQPFSRCMACNGDIIPVEKQTVVDRILPNTCEVYEEFWECTACRRVYWKGPHWVRMERIIRELL